MGDGWLVTLFTRCSGARRSTAPMRATSSRSSWATLTRTVIIRMNGPDPAQAKSNTSGNTRTTVHAQRAYTIT
jgi:hypothetical protein